MANLVVLVERDVELEEASMRLREGSLTHVRHQPQLMLPHVGCVDRKAVAPPHEFEVGGSFFIGVRLEYSPEASDDLVIVGAVGISCDGLESLN